MKEPETPDSSPFQHDEPDDSPGFLLWKLVLLWQEKLAAVFAQFSITQTQYAILASMLWFEQQNEPPNQARLGEHARIDKMTISKAIRRLEEKHLVRRESSAMDTRAMHVRLTVAGRKLIHQAVIAVERADDDFFSCLTERQMEFWKTLAITIIAGNGHGPRAG